MRIRERRSRSEIFLCRICQEWWECIYTSSRSEETSDLVGTLGILVPKDGRAPFPLDKIRRCICKSFQSEISPPQLPRSSLFRAAERNVCALDIRRVTMQYSNKPKTLRCGMLNALGVMYSTPTTTTPHNSSCRNREGGQR